MSKPRVAIFDFACCEGCQLQIVDMEEDLLNMLEHIEPVEWREAMSEQSEEYDIAIIEGSICRQSDEERLKEIRQHAKVLIALGACATLGGVNKLVNSFDNLDEVKRAVYGDAARMPHLITQPVKAVGEVVPVDFQVQGCPINGKEFVYIIRSLLQGTTPIIPNFPVCVECKMRENVCRFEYNEVCLGPVTRAGCNAPCPSGGMWCFGCRGMVDEPNLNGARDVMERYRKTADDLMSRFDLFNTGQERTHA
jgi:coenzyme F420-reducing hydrogenase gamma subunit